MGQVDEPRKAAAERLLEAAENAAARHVPLRAPASSSEPGSLAELLTSIRSLTPAVDQTDSADMIRALRNE